MSTILERMAAAVAQHEGVDADRVSASTTYYGTLRAEHGAVSLVRPHGTDGVSATVTLPTPEGSVTGTCRTYRSSRASSTSVETLKEAVDTAAGRAAALVAARDVIAERDMKVLVLEGIYVRGLRGEHLAVSASTHAYLGSDPLDVFGDLEDSKAVREAMVRCLAGADARERS